MGGVVWDWNRRERSGEKCDELVPEWVFADCLEFEGYGRFFGAFESG